VSAEALILRMLLQYPALGSPDHHSNEYDEFNLHRQIGYKSSILFISYRFSILFCSRALRCSDGYHLLAVKHGCFDNVEKVEDPIVQAEVCGC
jgi:hypothetical protein